MLLWNNSAALSPCSQKPQGACEPLGAPSIYCKPPLGFAVCASLCTTQEGLRSVLRATTALGLTPSGCEPMPAWVLHLPQKVSADGCVFPSTAPRHAGSTPDPSREVSWTHFLSGTQGKAGDGDTSPALPAVLAPKPAQNSSCLHFAQQAVRSAGCRAQGTGRALHQRLILQPVPKPQPGKTPSPCSLEPSTHVQCPPRMCCHLHTYFPPQPPIASPSCILGHRITPCQHSRNILLRYWGIAHFGILGYSPLTCTPNPSGCNMGNHRVRPGQD